MFNRSRGLGLLRLLRFLRLLRVLRCFLLRLLLWYGLRLGLRFLRGQLLHLLCRSLVTLCREVVGPPVAADLASTADAQSLRCIVDLFSGLLVHGGVSEAAAKHRIEPFYRRIAIHLETGDLRFQFFNTHSCSKLTVVQTNCGQNYGTAAR